MTMKTDPTTITVSLDRILERETTRADETTRGGVCRGVVATVENDSLLVDVASRSPRHVRCDVLDTGAAVRFAPGDPVVVLLPQDLETRGCVLGKVRRVDPSGAVEAPESLTLEARRELTLRVGEGSVTLRADGRVLIKGEAITSTARKLNRIRGGAVSLN